MKGREEMFLTTAFMPITRKSRPKATIFPTFGSNWQTASLWSTKTTGEKKCLLSMPLASTAMASNLSPALSPSGLKAKFLTLLSNFGSFLRKQREPSSAL